MNNFNLLYVTPRYYSIKLFKYNYNNNNNRFNFGNSKNIYTIYHTYCTRKYLINSNSLFNYCYINSSVSFFSSTAHNNHNNNNNNNNNNDNTTNTTDDTSPL